MNKQEEKLVTEDIIVRGKRTIKKAKVLKQEEREHDWEQQLEEYLHKKEQE